MRPAASRHREGVALKRAQPLAARAVAAPLGRFHLDIPARDLFERPRRGDAGSNRARPALLKRIDLLVLQLAPQLERLLAGLRQRDELDAAQGPSSARASGARSAGPTSWSRRSLAGRARARHRGVRLGVPDLRRCQLPHRLILAFIPGFRRGFQRTISDGRGTAEGLNNYHAIVIPDVYGTPRNDTGCVRGGRIRRGRSKHAGPPESALGLPSPADAFPRPQAPAPPHVTTPHERAPRVDGTGTSNHARNRLSRTFFRDALQSLSRT